MFASVGESDRIKKRKKIRVEIRRQTRKHKYGYVSTDRLRTELSLFFLFSNEKDKRGENYPAILFFSNDTSSFLYSI